MTNIGRFVGTERRKPATIPVEERPIKEVKPAEKEKELVTPKK